MATLHIPDELVNPFIEFVEVGLSVLALADYELNDKEKSLYDLLEQFIENHSGPKPCPYCQSIEIKLVTHNKYLAAQTCMECDASGPNIAGDDESESDLLRWNQRVGEGICPWCHFIDDPMPEGDDGKFFVWCPKCESCGPMANTPERAEELWKNRTR